MNTPVDLTTVYTAKSPFDAQVVTGVLQNVGIPVYVGSQMLNDEFAASRRLVGLTAVDVQVRKKDVELARAALELRAESAALLDDENFDPGDPIPGETD